MLLDAVRRVALALPEVTEEPHHALTSFRVRKRIFLTAHPDGEFVHAFVPAEVREEMTFLHPTFCSKLTWGGRVVGVRVALAGAKAPIVCALVKRAWREKAPANIATGRKPSARSAPTARAPASRRAPDSSGRRLVDAYLARLPPEARRTLELLRGMVHRAAPGVEECIGYKMPAFRIEGRILLYIAASRDRCCLYHGSATVVDAFADDLVDFETSKGTIRFAPGAMLSERLVRAIVKYRIAENREAPPIRPATGRLPKTTSTARGSKKGRRRSS